MPKKYRLARADFAHLSHGSPRRLHGSYFSLTIIALPHGGGPKMACVVSKKVTRRAVDRNRVQRRCREIIFPYIIRIKKPLALVLYAKREAKAASFADTTKDITVLLARAGVLA